LKGPELDGVGRSGGLKVKICLSEGKNVNKIVEIKIKN